MYNLFYWAYSPKLMCTFSNYADCKRALSELQNKYPTAKIWYEPVRTINSYEEWFDRFNGTISEYKK